MQAKAARPVVNLGFDLDCRCSLIFETAKGPLPAAAAAVFTGAIKTMPAIFKWSKKALWKLPVFHVTFILAEFANCG